MLHTFCPCTLASVISDDVSMPIMFCFNQQFLINLSAQEVICSSLQRLENNFTITSKGAFRLFWTSLLWLLDSSPLISHEISKGPSSAAEEILNIFFGPFISLEIPTRISLLTFHIGQLSLSWLAQFGPCYHNLHSSNSFVPIPLDVISPGLS